MRARDAFIDDVDSNTQRYVIRLWLRHSEASWPVAQSLNSKHEDLYNTDPDTQQLLMLSEWSAMARVQRITGLGSASSHD